MEISQKTLDRLLTVALLVFKDFSQLDLVFKVQLIAFSSAKMMQAVSDLPDKRQGAFQGVVFRMGQQAEVFQIPGLFGIKFNLRDPQHGVVIPQATLALFQVGLEQIGGISEMNVAGLIAFDQPVDDRTGFLTDDLFPQLAHEVRVQERPAADEAGIQQRGQYFEILGGKRNTLFQRPGRITDIKADIPQRVNHFPNKVFSLIRHPFFEQK